MLTEDITKVAAGKAGQAGISSNTARVSSHAVHYSLMNLGCGGELTSAIAAKVDRDRGGCDNMTSPVNSVDVAPLLMVGGWQLAYCLDVSTLPLDCTSIILPALINRGFANANLASE